MAPNSDATIPLRDSRHEAFAILLVEGRSQSAAYREIYPRCRTWKTESVHEKASKLAAKVRPRVSALQGLGVSEAIMTRNELAEYLTGVIRTPVGKVGSDSPLVQEYSADNSGVRVRMVSKIAAAAELAKLMGWYAPEKTDYSFGFKPDAAVYDALSAASGRADVS